VDVVHIAGYYYLATGVVWQHMVFPFSYSLYGKIFLLKLMIKYGYFAKLIALLDRIRLGAGVEAGIGLFTRMLSGPAFSNVYTKPNFHIDQI
jgi:hypothetical protein